MAKAESLVIASNDLRPVSIQRDSTSPVAAGLREHYDKIRSLSSLLADACKGKDMLQIGTENAEEIVSFLYIPPGRPDSAFLVVHAPLLKAERTIKALLPDVKDTQAPQVFRVTNNEETTHLTNAAESGLTLRLPAGSVSAVVEFSQSIKYPNEEGAEFWICAPDAKSQKLQYRSVKPAREPVPQALSVHGASEMTKPDQIVDVQVDSQPAPSVHDVPDLITDDGDSIKSNETTLSCEQEPNALLDWMKRFFLSFWSWLFGSPQRTATSDSRDENAVPASGTVTPNERTHLLSVSNIEAFRV